MDYEKEQARLLQLFDEVQSEEEDYGSDGDGDGDDERDKEDYVERRSESSGSEQEFDDAEDDNIPDATTREPYFTGKDNITKWNKNCPPKNVRTAHKNIVLQLPGVKTYAKSKKLPMDIWLCLFDEEMLNIIVDCTNIKIESVSQNFTRERDARPTTFSEIKALIGLLYLAGVRKANHMNLADLWRTDGNGVEAFHLGMNRNRFQFLMRCVRFDDIHTRQDRIQIDKLAPIRILFEKFNCNQKKCYSHSAYVTVDEKLEAFRGRCSFRQYIPSKPNKYGIKIFALSDSKLFYTSHMEVYVGKQPDGPFQNDTTAKSVVERLCQHIFGSNRNVTTDNWFTSMELAESLKSNKLTLLGTIRKNKKQLPLNFVQNAGRPIGSSMFGFTNDTTLVSYIPKKGKNVLLVSTMHMGNDIDADSNKPEMIMTYNDTKGGVDVVDKLCSSYNCARGTRRWPMVPFYSMLNVAGINAFVIYNGNNPESKLPRKEFLLRLSHELLNDYQKERAVCINIPRTIRMRLQQLCGIQIEEERPVRNPGAIGRCGVCNWKKNRKTKYFCQGCAKYLCLEHVRPLCNECYEKQN